MSSNDDDVARDIYKRIEKERTLINAANAMRQATDNPAVLSRVDAQIRDGRRNIEYFEGRLKELQMKKMNQGMDNMNLGSNGGQKAGGYGGSGMDSRSQYAQPGEYGDAGQDYSQLSGGNQIMPPSAPFAKPPPGDRQGKSRPNYSRLGKDTADQVDLMT